MGVQHALNAVLMSLSQDMFDFAIYMCLPSFFASASSAGSISNIDSMQSCHLVPLSSGAMQVHVVAGNDHHIRDLGEYPSQKCIFLYIRAYFMHIHDQNLVMAKECTCIV